jgi:hypothetical protein
MRVGDEAAGHHKRDGFPASGWDDGMALKVSLTRRHDGKKNLPREHRDQCSETPSLSAINFSSSASSSRA